MLISKDLQNMYISEYIIYFYVFFVSDIFQYHCSIIFTSQMFTIHFQILLITLRVFFFTFYSFEYVSSKYTLYCGHSHPITKEAQWCTVAILILYQKKLSGVLWPFSFYNKKSSVAITKINS